MSTKFYLSVAETVQALGISKSSLSRLVQAGKIISVKLGRRRLFSIEVLKQLNQQAISQYQSANAGGINHDDLR